MAVLHTLDAGRLYNDRDVFVADLAAAFNAADIRLAAPIKKATPAALSERDETAEICCDADGNPEADSELRDFENVPPKESVYGYFEREVLPHVHDAWINKTVRDDKDGEVGKVGYEIPLTRHFYKYVPPRPLEEFETAIAELEKEFMERLVVGWNAVGSVDEKPLMYCVRFAAILSGSPLSFWKSSLLVL